MATVGWKKKFKKIVDTHPDRGRVAPDMERNVTITIDIPLPMREKLIAYSREMGLRLKHCYGEIFQLGFVTSEKAITARNKVPDSLGKNRRGRTC